MIRPLLGLCAAVLSLSLAVSPNGSLAETEPPHPVRVFGDLTHLTFTATGTITTELVAPRDGTATDVPAAEFDVATVAGAGVELKVNGAVIPFSQIGERTVDGKTGETHYHYYGVPLAPGPNLVELTGLGADGLRGTTTTAHIYGPGKPERIDASVAGNPVADGKTAFAVHIATRDRFGHPASASTIVRVAIIRGDARFRTAPHAPPTDATPTAGATPVIATPAIGSAPDTNAAPVTNATPTNDPELASPGPADEPLPTPSSDLAPQPRPNDVDGFRPIGDLDVSTQQIDVTIGRGGVVDVPVIGGLRPGELLFRVTYEDAVVDVRGYLSPAPREPLILGVASAGVGSVPGVPGAQPNAPDGADSRHGRVALYGIGRIAGQVQATFAYDTADVLDETNANGSLTDNPDARRYLTYGDASARRDDALSRDHLYARVDDGRSNAMWGEFVADTAGANALGGFSQLVSGAKAEVGGSNANVTIFQARNDVAYARQVFAPTGLADMGSLLHSNIVVGSDAVTLVSIDRHSGAILAQTVLTRNVDYVLDDVSGDLRFLNPPLPFDISFNPQNVVVTYEYGGSGVIAETAGGRVSVALGASQAVKIEAGYANDTTGTGNVAVFGQDVRGALPGGSWQLSHLSTRGTGITNDGGALQLGSASSANGDAYRASILTGFGPNKVDVGFDTTSAGFDNPFGGLATPGLLDYHANFTRALAGSGSVTVGFEHDQNIAQGLGSSQSDASIHARRLVGKHLTVTAGVDLRSSSAYAAPASAPGAVASAPPVVATNPGGGVAQGQLGFEYTLNRYVKLQASRIADLGKNANLANPGQTAAELDLDVPKRGRLFVRELWTDAGTEPFAASTAALAQSSAAHSTTEIGVERSLGAATTVDSDYVVDRTASGTDAYAEIGVRERLTLAKNLKGDLTLQRAADFGGAGAGVGTNASAAFNLYGLALAYATPRFHATTQYELRTGAAAGYTLDVGAAGELSPSLSAFVTGRSSSSAAGFNDVDDRATLAYRPAQNDRGVMLLSYELHDGNVSALGTRAQVLSLESLYRPTHATEVAVRFAYALDGDAYYPATSELFGVRIDQRLTPRFDIAAENRNLLVRGIPGASVAAIAVEGGYRLGDGMRVAAGYNFAGSPDPSLVAAPTRRGIYATFTSTIDRIFGWGKGTNS